LNKISFTNCKTYQSFMKNFTPVLTLLLCLFTFSVFGQSAVQKKRADLNVPAIMDKTSYDGSEFLPLNHEAHPIATPRFAEEKVIGNTYYDLQSNGTNQNRIVRFGDKISATWTTSEEPSHANRGSGYNHFDGSDWGGVASMRLEESVRTGWPSLTVGAGEDELIACHGSPAPFLFHTLQKNSGAADWTEADVPSLSPGGLLWPRTASGDGQTIHGIAITTPVGNGGMMYEGVDGHILYYRSPDNGSTWDKVDVILPGMDSTNYVSNAADSYAIDARGDVVAVAVFGGFSDVVVFKSTDAGETWTEHTVNDFPLEKYAVDQGYTINDIPMDPNAPDTLAIFSSDGSGSVLIDNNDMVHVVFGNMYVADTDLGDGNTSYYPATDGISYWNENHGEDSVRTIVSVWDVNGNDTLDVAGIANIALYYQSLTTFPSLGIDEDGNIFLSYSGLMEDLINTQDDQHYRHAFLTASMDGGENWIEPLHLGIEEFFPDLPEVMEMVFTTIARHVDESVHMVMQRDFRPGLSVRGDMDPTELNEIIYLEIPQTFIFPVNNEEVELEPQSFAVMPNPTTGHVTIDLTSVRSTTLIVTDMLGRTVMSIENAGGFFPLDLSDLEDGVYFISAKVGNELMTEKVLLNR
jgi:hypothetical protein